MLTEGRFMIYRHVVVVAIVCLLQASALQTFAQDAAPLPEPLPTRSKAFQYRESAQRTMRFNACVRAGRGECYRTYRDAVRWCVENWEECFPKLEHASVSAEAYGREVTKKCFSGLEERCRQEVDK